MLCIEKNTHPCNLTRNNFMLKQFSNGPKNHFFGYYGINPWNSDQAYHLALETDFHDRIPTPNDIASVGLVDHQTGNFTALATTSAFNLQQGTMMHWINTDWGEELTYNDWEGDELVSRAINLKTKTRRTIQGAIATVSPYMSYAIGLNFARMSVCRQVVGYANSINPKRWREIPEDDGLSFINLKEGSADLIVSIKDVINQSDLAPSECGLTWFNHVMINPSGTRVFFFCRSRLSTPVHGSNFITSLWTVNPNGSNLQCQIPFGYKISHFAWRDEQRMLMTTSVLGKMQFVEFTDNKADFNPIGSGKLPSDGHACYSPNGKWLVTDTYPNQHTRISTLLLYHLESQEVIPLGNSYAHPKFTGTIRCDLHPRWSPDGQIVTIDSVDQGDRQIYIADLQKYNRFIELNSPSR